MQSGSLVYAAANFSNALCCPVHPTRALPVQIKERTKESTSIHTELTRLIVDRWHDMLSLLPRGPARAGRQKLDALLRSWAGADVAGKATKVEEVDKKGEGSGEGEGGEGEVQADGEEGKQAAPGGRTLQVLGQALDEDTLCDVLSEALAPFDAADAAGGAKAKGEGAATAEEVSALAKFVLQRYGSRAAAEGQVGGAVKHGEGSEEKTGDRQKANQTLCLLLREYSCCMLAHILQLIAPILMA